MNFSLKPHPIISHWVPGMVVVTTALLAWYQWKVAMLLNVFADSASTASVSVFVLAVVAFIAGEILDSYRNSREGDDINWDFFFTGSQEKVDRLCEFYFTYYMLNMNLKNAILVAAVIFGFWPPGWAMCFTLKWLGIIFMSVVAIVILWRDAKALRKEMAKHTKHTKSPHFGVYTKLKPSKVHEGGVGVFAIQKIPKGTSIFYGDEDTELVDVDKAKSK